MNDRDEIISDQAFWSRLEYSATAWLATAADRNLRRFWIDGFMQHFNIIFFISALWVAGCASDKPVYPLPRAAFPEPAVYLVQPGDSAGRIAKNLCLSMERLSALNPGIDWSRLKIGQRLYYASPPSN